MESTFGKSKCHVLVEPKLALAIDDEGSLFKLPFFKSLPTKVEIRSIKHDAPSFENCKFENISLSSAGFVLLVWSRSNAGVLRKNTNYTFNFEAFACKSCLVGDAFIVKACFHPHSPNTVVILFSVGTLLIVDLESMQEERIELNRDKTFTSFSFGPNMNWLSLSALLLEETGDIYLVSPLVPGNLSASIPHKVIDEVQDWIDNATANNVDSSIACNFIDEYRDGIMEGDVLWKCEGRLPILQPYPLRVGGTTSVSRPKAVDICVFRDVGADRLGVPLLAVAYDSGDVSLLALDLEDYSLGPAWDADEFKKQRAPQSLENIETMRWEVFASTTSIPHDPGSAAMRLPRLTLTRDDEFSHVLYVCSAEFGTVAMLHVPKIAALSRDPDAQCNLASEYLPILSYSRHVVHTESDMQLAGAYFVNNGLMGHLAVLRRRTGELAVIDLSTHRRLLESSTFSDDIGPVLAIRDLNDVTSGNVNEKSIDMEDELDSVDLTGQSFIQAKLDEVDLLLQQSEVLRMMSLDPTRTVDEVICELLEHAIAPLSEAAQRHRARVAATLDTTGAIGENYTGNCESKGVSGGDSSSSSSGRSLNGICGKMEVRLNQATVGREHLIQELKQQELKRKEAEEKLVELMHRAVNLVGKTNVSEHLYSKQLADWKAEIRTTKLEAASLLSSTNPRRPPLSSHSAAVTPTAHNRGLNRFDQSPLPPTPSTDRKSTLAEPASNFKMQVKPGNSFAIPETPMSKALDLLASKSKGGSIYSRSARKMIRDDADSGDIATDMENLTLHNGFSTSSSSSSSGGLRLFVGGAAGAGLGGVSESGVLTPPQQEGRVSASGSVNTMPAASRFFSVRKSFGEEDISTSLFRSPEASFARPAYADTDIPAGMSIDNQTIGTDRPQTARVGEHGQCVEQQGILQGELESVQEELENLRRKLELARR